MFCKRGQVRIGCFNAVVDLLYGLSQVDPVVDFAMDVRAPPGDIVDMPSEVFGVKDQNISAESADSAISSVSASSSTLDDKVSNHTIFYFRRENLI